MKILLLFCKFLKNNFYWSIVDLQCCVNFCYTAKWIRYIWLHSFLDSFHIYPFYKSKIIKKKMFSIVLEKREENRKLISSVSLPPRDGNFVSILMYLIVLSMYIYFKNWYHSIYTVLYPALFTVISHSIVLCPYSSKP